VKFEDVLILLPLVIVAASAVAALLAIAVRRSHAATVGIALGGLAAALGALLTGPWGPTYYIGGGLETDVFADFMIGLILSASMVVCVLSYGYFSRRRERPEEFYVLLLLAALGAMVLAVSIHFATFFLGLEILSVALYGLVAYERGRLGVEAGLKYLVLGGVGVCIVRHGASVL